MNRRNTVLALLSLAAAGPLGTAAQQSGAKRRIGFLFSNASQPSQPIQQVLLEQLRLVGYEDGKNILVEWRFAEGKVDRLFDLAQDLVLKGVELIVAGGNDACLAAKRATISVPIVMFNGNVPVEMGLVQSLSHPGGNVTGTTNNFPQAAGKVLEVLRDSAPRIKRVAILWNPESPGMRYYAIETDQAAKAFGIVLQYFEVVRQEQLSGVLQQIAAGRPDALFLVGSPATFTRFPEITAFALQHKLPSVGTSERFVDLGGMLYYGPDNSRIAERTISFVNRILRGAKPADLPIEQPTNFDFIVNIKTARALGLKIPQSILVRANRVIE